MGEPKKRNITSRVPRCSVVCGRRWPCVEGAKLSRTPRTGLQRQSIRGSVLPKAVLSVCLFVFVVRDM